MGKLQKGQIHPEKGVVSGAYVLAYEHSENLGGIIIELALTTVCS